LAIAPGWPLWAHPGEGIDPALAAWVAAHPQVRFGPERDYGPFVFVDEGGRLRGLSIDVLDIVAGHTRLDLKPLPPRPLADWLDAARRGEVDLLSSLRPTPERGEFLEFTQPYVSVPAVVVMRQGRAPDALAAMSGRKVAVGKGYAVEAYVREHHPAVLWQAVADDVAALKGVAAGEFDAAVADTASVAFVSAQHHLGGLVQSERLDFEYRLSFAVRKDWPQLRAVLDAGIGNISAGERQALVERWMAPLAAQAPPPRAPWATRIAVVLIVTGLLLAAWQWRRRRRDPRPPGDAT
jgi:ABC-type amino acid transport substrate-binding protein